MSGRLICNLEKRKKSLCAQLVSTCLIKNVLLKRMYRHYRDRNKIAILKKGYLEMKIAEIKNIYIL